MGDYLFDCFHFTIKVGEQRPIEGYCISPERIRATALNSLGNDCQFIFEPVSVLDTSIWIEEEAMTLSDYIRETPQEAV